MAKTIYKISSYLNRKSTSGTFLGGGSASGGRVDLSNYYTKSELQTEGLSVVDFYNIANAYHNDMLGLEGGSIADNSSGESSGMAGEYYHFDFENWDRLMFLNFSMSLVEDVSNIVTLVNDESDPGLLKYYGTGASGAKGWYDVPVFENGSSGGGDIIVEGVAPVDNILDWDGANNWYAPYDTKQGGKFYSGTSLPTDVSRLNYDGYFYATEVHANGDMYADDFILNSDRRLKTQIKSYKAEELIINYKQYRLKSDVDQQRFGIIAQEVQKLYPELVREVNGHLAVSYIDLLVREIANLKERVKELENR